MVEQGTGVSPYIKDSNLLRFFELIEYRLKSIERKIKSAAANNQAIQLDQQWNNEAPDNPYLGKFYDLLPHIDRKNESMVRCNDEYTFFHEFAYALIKKQSIASDRGYRLLHKFIQFTKQPNHTMSFDKTLDYLENSKVLCHIKRLILDFCYETTENKPYDDDTVSPYRINTESAQKMLRDLARSGPVDLTLFWYIALIGGLHKLDLRDFLVGFMKSHEKATFLIIQSKSDGLYIIESRRYSSEMSEFYDIVFSMDKINVMNISKMAKKDSETKQQFYSLYKKYLNALACNLVFAKCASQLTRVDKLFSKDIEVTNMELSPRGRSRKVILDHKNIGRGGVGKTVELHSQIRSIISKKPVNVTDSKSKYSEFWNYFSRILETDPKQKENKTDPKQEKIFCLSDLINANLNDGEIPYPLVINGEAGMGKTIIIHQTAFTYITNLEKQIEDKGIELMKTLPLPVFFKAKYWNRFATKPDRLEHGDWFESIISAQYSSFPDLSEYISSSEIIELFQYWRNFSQFHNSNITYFIDGLDEIDNLHLVDLISLAQNQQGNRAPFVICSTRPSHIGDVNKSIIDLKINVSRLSPEGTYTEEELSKDMPNKLCDAWGINRDTADKLFKNIEQYRTVIQHPLFVGWVCFLIYTNQITSTDEIISENAEIATNNLLTKIITIGIESSLSRKDVELKNPENFERYVRSFVAFSHHYSILHPNKVFTKLEDILGLKLSKEEKNTIRNDCGILFLTSNKEIDWTHQRIAEIIYADYKYQNPGLLLGPLRISDPVITRIAQHEFERGLHQTYDEALILAYYKYYDSETFSKYIEDTQDHYYWEWIAEEDPYLHDELTEVQSGTYLYEMSAYDGYRIDPFIGLNKNGELAVLSNATDSARLIAELYLKSLGTTKQFKLNCLCFTVDSFDIIYGYSNHIFAKDVLIFPDYRLRRRISN